MTSKERRTGPLDGVQLPSSDGGSPTGRKATIRNVAKLAGVAPSTVSHYLNRTAPLAAETAQNVERAIAALNYRVNLGARGLRVKRTHSIGLIIPNINTPFFGELAAIIENVLWDRGYQMLLSISERDPEREASHLANLASRQVDGILVVYNVELPNRASLIRAPVPVVFLDRAVPGRVSVSTDNRLGGRMAAEHLLALGHRRIAVLRGESDIRNVAERIEGFNDALAEAGVTVAPQHTLEGRQDLELGARVGELFRTDPRPTAIFATNDIAAISAWCVTVRLGLRVPEDVSLLGYDGIAMSRFLAPPLTTVIQPSGTLGHRAVDLLMGMIGRSATLSALPDSEVLTPTLEVRGSTAPPSKGGALLA